MPIVVAATDNPKEQVTKKVAQLIDGMGFVVKTSAADYLVVQASGFLVALEPANDGSSLFVSTYYQVPKEKRAMMPYGKMLTYNGGSADFFGTSTLPDGETVVALITFLPVDTLSPRTLKRTIDQLTADANQNMALLDPGKWTSTPDGSSK